MNQSQQSLRVQDEVKQFGKPISLIFSDIWLFLNQNRVKWSSNQLNYFSSIIKIIQSKKQYLNSFKKESFCNYTIWAVQQQNKVVQNELESSGILFDYLNLSLRRTQAEKQLIKDKTSKNISKAFQIDYGKKLREYQEEAVFNRSLQIVCPFTGCLIYSIHSFPMNSSIFYRFESKEVFYVISFILSSGYCIDAIYFPSKEILVDSSLKNKNIIRKLKNNINFFRLSLSLNLEKVSKYLTLSKPKKIIILMGHQNFAHHLSNEIQAVQRLVEKDIINQVNEFWMMHEPLGSIARIYPEILPEKVKKVSELNILNKVFEEQAFAIRIGDNYVSNALKKRVYESALKNGKKSTIRLTARAKTNCFPLLWISIRLVNRTCTNQVNAFSQIILHLFREYPQLGVVFDGFSFPVDSFENNQYQTFDYSEENIKNINKVVEEISAHVKRQSPSIQIFNTTGCSLYESIIWAHAVDFYLCHHGTTQHKIGWLTNKPGVVHSNQETLSRPTYPEAKGSWINCKDAVYLLEEDVIDDEIPDLYKGDNRRNLSNYYLKWERAYEELLKISLLLLRD